MSRDKPGATASIHRLSLADCDHSAAWAFEAWAAGDPDRLAVRSSHGPITYAVLNRLGNRVAHHVLRTTGHGSQPVALCCDKDAPLLGALVGLLKAGKISVLLDPTHPADHARYILDDCGATLVLADAARADAARALAGPGRAVHIVDELDASLDRENPGAPVTGDTLATLVYTSGSTGRPKGVLQSHRNWLHTAMTFGDGVKVGPDDRFSLVQSMSGFGGVRVALTALVNGAAISPYDVAVKGMGGLAAWIRAEGITIMSLAVTGLRHLVAGLGPQDRYPAMRALKLSGEASRPADLAALRRHFPATTFWVGLASTETGYVSYLLLEPGTPLPDGNGSLGRPAHGVEVRIVDESGAAVPDGEVGEIVVRSRYLALGYWGRPDLTDAAFRPDPDGGDRRLYHMGDLGRIRPDGGLEHRGRLDAMVKLRGYRVELAAIESHLLALPEIAQAAVVARDRVPGDTRLVAHVVPHVRPGPEPSDVRRALARVMPAHMVPAHVVLAEALPRTALGKVDKGALPAPDWSCRGAPGPLVEPRTPIERELAAIWADALGVQAVGVTDDFLDLGGHSLLAGAIAGRVLARFQVGVSAAALLEAATVEAMGVVVAGALAATAGESLDTLVDGLLPEKPDPIHTPPDRA